jgi:NMT1/THI5 like.
MNRKIWKSLAIFCLLLLLTSCQSKGKDESGQESGSEKEEIPSLTIGVMPAVDAAPIFLAEEKGYFHELGLKVNIQIYTNAMNRQSALQAGELDGTITDLIALINNVANGFDVKVTTSTDGSFPFLVNPDFHENEKKDLKVGMMEVSVTNFLADRYLGKDYNLEKVYINEIPARLEMIAKGTLDLAVVPEPMASQGELNGLKKWMPERDDEDSPDVMVFTGKALKEKEKSIRLFHQAYNRAVEDILKDDSEARELLLEKLDLDPAIKDKMALPVYHQARVPDESYIREIMDWNETVLGEKVNVNYDQLVDGSFVQ